MVPDSRDCPFLTAPNFWFDILQRLYIEYWPFYQPCISMKYLTQSIRLVRIIYIPSKFYYFRPLDHVISMESNALDFRCQCTQQKFQSICAVLTFDPQLKQILKFSIKDRYQLNYFICIKNFNAETITFLKLNLDSFFICWCQHHQRKTVCLYIFLISDYHNVKK